MIIKNNKRYILNMGFDILITPISTPESITGAELRTALKADMDRARRYFGTAVMHSSQINDKVYINVTARRNERSALWEVFVILLIALGTVIILIFRQQ